MFSFELTQPRFLLGLLLAVIIVWRQRSMLPLDFSQTQRRILLVVRLMILLLLVLSLSGLNFLYPASQTQTVFLVEENQNTDAAAAQRYLDEAKKANGGKELTVIKIDGNIYHIQDNIEFAAAHIPQGFVSHLVFMSRGVDISQLSDVRSPLISTVPLPQNPTPQIQLTELKLPPQVQKGEPFSLDILLESNTEAEGVLTLFRDGTPVVQEAKTLRKGQNVFPMRQTAGDEKQTEYKATFVSKELAGQERSASNVLFLGGKPKVLIFDSHPSTLRDFTAALRGQGIYFDLRQPSAAKLSLSLLDNYDAVFLSDVPAASFTKEEQDAICVYVNDLGGGLMMFGGDHSFGLGGYYKTAIEEVLPVWCDFEKEKEKPSFALAIVLDRSGSMGGQKIALAKEAAKAAVDLLTPKDFVSVVAFDNESYPISPMQSAASKISIRSAISTIEAAGGTNIYPALLEARKQLQSVSAKLKHIILLTDGYSAPGDSDGIVRRITNDKITVSTVGVGDADNALLKTIANNGKGRHYACTDPQAIPQIFAKETLTASKTAIREEPFIPILMTPTETLTDIDLETAPPLLGFIATRAKPATQLILATETGEPLLMWRRFGLGMSAVFTSDPKAKWGAEWLTGVQYGAFWAQVVRKIMRKSEGRNTSIYIEQQRERVHITVEAVDENENFVNEATGTVLVVSGQSSVIPLQQTAPGRYEADIPLPGKTKSCSLRLLLQKDGKTVLEQTRSIIKEIPEELRVKPTDEASLKKLAEQTGGRFQPEPSDVFDAFPRRTTFRALPLFPYLLTIVTFLFIFEIFLKRMNLKRR